jgi:hypothetical protein
VMPHTACHGRYAFHCVLSLRTLSARSIQSVVCQWCVCEGGERGGR